MAQPPKMLQRRMVFGVREDVRNGIHYFDEDNIVWVAGQSLILQDTQLGTQQIIPCSPTCESITVLALSYNRRLLAVGESGKQPAIVIYQYEPTANPKLKRKKTLQVPDLGSSYYASLDLSTDGKHLIALGGFPDWKLFYWNVEKAKIVASCSAVLNPNDVKDNSYLSMCSLSPADSSIICVTGREVIAFFQLTDDRLTNMDKNIQGNGESYLSHGWLPEEPGKLIVTTGNGDLLWFENQELKFPLPLSPSDGLSINAIMPYSKGFVCGGDVGLIHIFERTDNKDMFRKVRTFRYNLDGESVPANQATQAAYGLEVPVILSFTVTPPPAEEYVAFLTSTKQINYLNLPNADFTRADDMVFRPVGQPFHSGPITGVDVSAQRPLVVTAGRDRQIILWNCLTNAVEMRKRFGSEILSVAIHPSGLHLLVGFADGLRLMNIYDKDICEFKNLGIRSCSACCFSHGGQFFAAMHSTTIHIYYTYTCELLGHLRGHNGKVRSLYFVPPGDTRLISTGTDGAVYEFNLRDFHKVSDNILKSVTYNCGVSDVSTVWVGGNDRKLRQFERNKLQNYVEYNLDNASLISMTISQPMKLLFGGCEDGTLRVFNTYLGEKLVSTNKETGTASRSIMIESHSTHMGVVSNLAMTWDESMMFSVGEDGLVVFWDIVAPQRALGKELQYSNELLMDRKDLEETAKIVANLKAQLSDLKQRNLQQQSKRERVHESQIAELAKEYEEELEKQTNMLGALEAEKSEQAIRFTEFMAELDEKSKKVLQQTKDDYEGKIASLQDRSIQLKSLIDERRREFEEKVSIIEEEASKERMEANLKHKAILEELDEENHQLMLEKEKNNAETETMSRFLEEDNDTQVISQNENYEKRRREQEEELSIIQGANSAMQSKENLNRADLEAKVADVNEKLRQQGALESQIDAAKRDIDALTNEFKERGETIAEKDRRIYDLKKKNQELEKFKFVLEYKIKELKAQIDPRDEEIRSAKEKLTHMGTEADQYQQSSENLSLQIRSLRQKRAGNQKEIDALHEKLKSVEEQQSRLWTELTNVYALCDESQGTAKERNSKLKEMVKALLEKYSDSKPASNQNTKILSARTAADEVREYNRQRDHLERNMTSLKKKVNKDAENNRGDRTRITAENVILVREINDLRKEARTLAAKAGVVIELDPSGASVYDEEWRREIEAQNEEIERLKHLSDDLEAQLRLKGIPLPQQQ